MPVFPSVSLYVNPESSRGETHNIDRIAWHTLVILKSITIHVGDWTRLLSDLLPIVVTLFTNWGRKLHIYKELEN